jgi:hypothetical protein
MKSKVFSQSSLKSIEIPRNVEFIDGSAFSRASCHHVSLEAGHERFAIKNDFLLDFVDHRLIRSFPSSSNIVIFSDIEILGSSCLLSCELLSLILFEPDSLLKCIDAHVCKGRYCLIIVPSTTFFIACNASRDPRQISLANVDPCPEYARWQQLRSLKFQVDFRRLRRFDSGLPSRLDCLFNLIGFREISQLSANERYLTQKYQECDGGFEIHVESMNVSVYDYIADLEKRIENVMNLRHPCISYTIGVVLPPRLIELQIVRQYSCGSLSDVISASPAWWTPMAKTKAIVGIVLSMRFAHSFGFLQGHLALDKVLFDDDVVQISDFYLDNLSEVGGKSEATDEIGGFSGEGWRPDTDVGAFAELLSTIGRGESADESGCSLSVPGFVLKMIKRGQSSNSTATLSFVEIFETLKVNDVRILEGVDSKEVSQLASWIEFSEARTE